MPSSLPNTRYAAGLLLSLVTLLVGCGDESPPLRCYMAGTGLPCGPDVDAGRRDAGPEPDTGPEPDWPDAGPPPPEWDPRVEVHRVAPRTVKAVAPIPGEDAWLVVGDSRGLERLEIEGDEMVLTELADTPDGVDEIAVDPSAGLAYVGAIGGARGDAFDLETGEPAFEVALEDDGFSVPRLSRLVALDGLLFAGTTAGGEVQMYRRETHVDSVQVSRPGLGRIMPVWMHALDEETLAIGGNYEAALLTFGDFGVSILWSHARDVHRGDPISERIRESRQGERLLGMGGGLFAIANEGFSKLGDCETAGAPMLVGDQALFVRVERDGWGGNTYRWLDRCDLETFELGEPLRFGLVPRSYSPPTGLLPVDESGTAFLVWKRDDFVELIRLRE
ncbi:MAG TPA: hypothetical protein RMI62_03825 [Polyangiaceae bacterium LLY-WYZ-15_(1-7)]|nr:hypothetical protein [Polyangiaceae bacterium LLY-WYZ-15_(1-7)]